jgi:hypothetical protein
LQIQLKQGGSLNPEMPAMLGCAYGSGSDHKFLFCRSALQARYLFVILAKALLQWHSTNTPVSMPSPNPVWRSRASQGKAA